MWLLSCDGEHLEGKRIWLRPGSTHLIGRTSSKQAAGCDRVCYVDHGSVSRKHLLLQVAEVKDTDSAHVHSRTTITATDGSKKGTFINGERLAKNGTKTLDSSDHRIKLGEEETTFLLEWKPVLIAVTGVSKGLKSKGLALSSEREKTKGADVKFSLEYVTNETTHVVGKKRNTAQGLHALIQARWLVTESFVDALADACKKRGASQDGQPGISPLEEDFDAHWPKETEYIIPTGGEPVPRPNDYLKPDPARASIFAEYTFVFLSQGQFDSLMSVVTVGGGKALLHEFASSESAVEDAVKFTKELAGKKDAQQFSLSQVPGPGGVVVVRINEKTEGRDSMPAVESALDQRAIEQGELLDIILSKDTSKLRQPLKDGSTRTVPSQATPEPSANVTRPPVTRTESDAVSGVVTVPDSPPTENQRLPRSGQEPPRSQPQPEQQTEEPPAEQPTTMRRNRRQLTKSRFKGFDDFDPSQIVKAESSAPQTQTASQAPGVEAMEVDEQAEETPGTQRSSRKRPAEAEPEEELETEEQFNARIFPTIAAAKRQKTEALKNGEKSHSKSHAKVDSPVPPPEEASTGRTKKTKKVASKDEADMKAKLKAKIEADDEVYRKDEEAREEMRNNNLEEMEVTVKIETFDLPERPAAAGARTVSREDHPEWNGRKNFKKFRSNKNRDRTNHVEAPESQVTKIALLPVPGRNAGLGDEYWLETGRNSRRKDGSQSQSQSVSRRQTDDSDEDDALAFRRHIRRSREEDAERAETENIMNEDEATASAQSLTQGRGGKAAGKRPAAKDGLGGPPAKKARQSTLAGPPGRPSRQVDEDSDDDPMTFKRRRR